jgi:beta-lactamase regulating signal transducer with metallopeptidase domain
VIAVVIINSLWCAACALVAFAPATMARRAATRYTLWYIALAVNVALPPLTLLLQPVIATRVSTPSSLAGGWFAMLLLLAWLVGTLAAVARGGVDLVRARRLLRGGVADARITRIAEEVRRELRTSRAFETQLSGSVTSPHFVGLWRPTVVLPLSFRELNDETVRAVLLHEVAHVRRRDDLLIATEHLAEAVLFFNPAIRFMRRRLDRERELACDELACSRVAVSRYVSTLLLVAKNTQSTLGLAAARTALTWRVRMLLTRRTTPWRNDLRGVAASVCCVVLLASLGFPHLARRVVAPLAKDGAEDTATRVAPGSRTRGTEEARNPRNRSTDDGAVHFYNGWSLLTIGQYDGAIEELVKARELGYEPLASAANLAVAYERKGDLTAARSWEARAREAPRGTYPTNY